MAHDNKGGTKKGMLCMKRMNESEARRTIGWTIAACIAVLGSCGFGKGFFGLWSTHPGHAHSGLGLGGPGSLPHY